MIARTKAENEENFVLKAGLDYLWFETLYRLDDGNGHIGRKIMDMAMAIADQLLQGPYGFAPQIH